MNCLVTKLQGVVSDNTLKKMGEIRLFVNTEGGDSLDVLRRSDTKGELSISSIDGVACLSTTPNGGWVSEIDLAYRESNYTTKIYFAKGTYEVSVLFKDALCGLTSLNAQFLSLDSQDLAYSHNLVDFNLANIGGTFDIAEVSKLDKIEQMSFNGMNYVGNLEHLKIDPLSLGIASTSIVGDVSSLSKLTKIRSINLSRNTGVFGDAMKAISNCYNLTSITVSRNDYIQGDLENLKGLANVNHLDISLSKITGNINHLGKMTKLTRLGINDSNVYGSIEEMVQGFVQNGKASGSLLLTYAKNITNVTYSGQTMKAWMAANLPNNSDATLSWENDSITIG